MNTYLLILSILLKTSYAGNTDITVIEVKDQESCVRIGQTWMNDVRLKLDTTRNEIIYTCVEK